MTTGDGKDDHRVLERATDTAVFLPDPDQVQPCLADR
jgi:hypothetical protein